MAADQLSTVYRTINNKLESFIFCAVDIDRLQKVNQKHNDHCESISRLSTKSGNLRPMIGRESPVDSARIYPARQDSTRDNLVKSAVRVKPFIKRTSYEVFLKLCKTA